MQQQQQQQQPQHAYCKATFLRIAANLILNRPRRSLTTCPLGVSLLEKTRLVNTGKITIGTYTLIAWGLSSCRCADALHSLMDGDLRAHDTETTSTAVGDTLNELLHSIVDSFGFLLHINTCAGEVVNALHAVQKRILYY